MWYERSPEGVVETILLDYCKIVRMRDNQESIVRYAERKELDAGTGCLKVVKLRDKGYIIGSMPAWTWIMVRIGMKMRVHYCNPINNMRMLKESHIRIIGDKKQQKQSCNSPSWL